MHRAPSPGIAIAGLAWASVPFALVLAATRRVQLAAWSSALLCFALYLLSRVKIHYYKEPLLASDFYLVADPTNWETLLHYPLAALPFVVLPLGIAALAILYRREPRVRSTRALAVLGLAAAHLGGAFVIAQSGSLASRWQAALPKGVNPYADLVMSTRMRFVPPDPKGDAARFEKVVSQLALGAAQSRPDIVVWLQESTLDPRVYELPQGAQPPRLRMFEPDARTHASGPLRVHTFGGGTWRSEFALMSGLPSSDFGVAGGAVFYVVTPHLTHSLFRELRRHGYRTVVLTPFNKSAYHARSAYADMGVEIVLQPQDLGHRGKPSDNLWDISSADMAGYARKVLERYADRPIFLFMLTMKEHGPYDPAHAVGFGLEALPDRALAGRLSDYFTRLEALDGATQGFADAFLGRERPGLFLYFGDHQPNIASSALRYRTARREPYLVTQFVLRDNLPRPARAEPPITDLALLGGLLLERAGLPPSPFYAANIAMRKACEGGLEDCPQRQLVADYQDYIYRKLEIVGPLPPRQ